MPRKEINYLNTIIYKIVCNDLNVKDTYVGHTTDFIKRKATHKSHCINENDTKHNLKVYKMIRDNGNWNNWSMIEIEKYPCGDSNEACSRERYWYELLNANMNTLCPTFNVEKRKEYEKEYYDKNKDLYFKEHNKVYYDNNKEYFKEYNKEYYDNNKERINEKNNCLCGGCYTYSHKSHHLKTIKHQNYIKTLNNGIKPII